MIRFASLPLLLFPVWAVAQELPAPPAGDDPAPSRRLVLDLEAARLDPIAGVLPTAERTQPVPPAPQPPAQPEPRRRPSMVGYIGDSSIGSSFRVRFDAGYGMTAVDRAEFFYAKCGCYRDLPSDHPFLDPAAPGPGPGIVTGMNFQQLYLLGEYAFAENLSVFGEMPVRWLQPQAFVPGLGSFGSRSGLSDMRLGVKAAPLLEPDRTVTVLLQLTAPTGDSLQGLGTDHWSVEPAVLYYAALTDRVAFESQFGAVLPTSGSAGLPTAAAGRFSGSVLYYGGGASYRAYDDGRLEIAPVVELVGWRVLGGFQTLDFADVSGVNILNLKLGARATVGGGSSVYAGWGRALTDAVWYQDIVRLEYRLAF